MDKEEMNFVKTKKLKVTEPNLKYKGGNSKRTTIREESFIDRNDGWKEDNAIWVKVDGEWRPWGSTYKVDLAELDPAFVAKYEEVQILPNDGSRPEVNEEVEIETKPICTVTTMKWDESRQAYIIPKEEWEDWD